MLSLSEFFAMGGYAEYVWSSYALVALVFVCIIWRARRNRRQVMFNLKQWLAKQNECATKKTFD